MAEAPSYDIRWSQMRLRPPHFWYTWKIIEPYAREAGQRLEIGAGIFPKFPIEGTFFLDTSENAVRKLEQKGGKAVVADVGTVFPFPKVSFELAGGFEVLEHIPRPENTIKEIARVLKPNGLFIFSTPIHQKFWSRWDEFAGHVQRFEPEQLDEMLRKEGLFVEHCYSAWRLKHGISVFRNMFSAFYPIVARYPGACSKIYDYLSPPHAWLSGKVSRMQHYSALKDVPENNTNILVVCRKSTTASLH